MKTILIVEDDELNMKLLRDILEVRGDKTICAYYGMTALPLAREHLPDLILMNISLSDVSGLEVTNWIKRDSALKHIPVIAVTGFAMKGDQDRILEGGCDAYIPKPIELQNFLGVLRKALGES